MSNIGGGGGKSSKAVRLTVIAELGVKNDDFSMKIM